MDKTVKTILYIAGALVALYLALFIVEKLTGKQILPAAISGSGAATSVPQGNDSSGNPYTYKGYSAKTNNAKKSTDTSAWPYFGIDATTRGFIDQLPSASAISTLQNLANSNNYTWVPALPAAPKTGGPAIFPSGGSGTAAAGSGNSTDQLIGSAVADAIGAAIA